ncbi:hypothetical protein DFH06DRAFT_140078 [Mycena polygramma]|nr:hypothetical protein DFH06DRAFT_140078 [Mycena polygramma]
MVFPTLPIELHEEIIGYLHGDVPTLKSCSLVCQAWRLSTRTRLFYRFNAWHDAFADDASLPGHCGKYVREVSHLADYIREIDIQDGTGGLLTGLEARALCAILDRIHTLRRLSISTSPGHWVTMRPWREVSPQFRLSLSAALRRSSSSLTHILLDGFYMSILDIEPFSGLRCLEYVGLERMDIQSDETDLLPTVISENPPGSLRTLSVNFNFPGLRIRPFVHAVNVSNITNLRLGGVVNTSVLLALSPEWLLNVTHLGLELTNLNPTHPSSPLSDTCIAEVPAFSAMQALELSLNLYPPVVPHDLSALEIFLARLLPAHRLASIITTVTERGPPNYIEALRQHYNYCLARADVVKVRWEDGKLEELEPAFMATENDQLIDVIGDCPSPMPVPGRYARPLGHLLPPSCHVDQVIPSGPTVLPARRNKSPVCYDALSNVKRVLARRVRALGCISTRTDAYTGA